MSNWKPIMSGDVAKDISINSAGDERDNLKINFQPE